MQPPKPPGSEVPQRTANCRLEELVGLTARELESRLGDADVHLNYEVPPRPQGGYFGPAVAEALQADEPCRCWTYKNIGGSNWVVWLARRKDDGTRPKGLVGNFQGNWVVVGVTSYPVGAVF